jgi:FkbH-like protein
VSTLDTTLDGIETPPAAAGHQPAETKAGSVRQVAEAINIGLDTVAFVDDQPFERDEVTGELPEVRTYDASELPGLADHADFVPRFITDESAMRRKMYQVYQADAQRKQAEGDHEGPSEEFLAGLGMRFVIHPPRDEDLKRAEELTMRTNQLNTTGYTYCYDELDALRHDPGHLLLVAGLEDRYGTYGKIGLVLVEKGAEVWTLKLLLMSCRVMSRGVGTILMNHVMALAKQAGAKLRAEFRSNGRNRMMRVTYRLGGFTEVETDGESSLLDHDLEHIQNFPEHVQVRVEE